MKIIEDEMLGFWQTFHNEKENKAAFVAVGVQEINLFRPRRSKIDTSDRVKILAMTGALLATIEKLMEKGLPADVVRSVTTVLLAGYGVGLRRGANKVNNLGQVKPFKDNLADQKPVSVSVKRKGKKKKKSNIAQATE